MPITPFHFGPGALVHGIAPRYVSFLSFCTANVLIDVEPGYYMMTGQFPLHRFLHTIIGATLVIAAIVVLYGAMKRLVLIPNILRWRELTKKQVAIGAALGAYSHLIFDSIMHLDIRPLSPFSESNAFLNFVPLSELHLFCVAAGILGFAVLAIRAVLKKSEWF
jgi:membrane-bound metal-dependent hydrolase YbcI (DUF457 family)